MHRFFIQSSQLLPNQKAVLNDENDVKHLVRVLRAEVGEQVELCVDHTKELVGRIESIEPSLVYFVIESEKTTERESPLQITLFQGLPKADKMEWIVQKNVELGINYIVPVQMTRSVAKISDEKDNKKKTERWQKIADEAAKQSKRLAQVTIEPCVKFKGIEKRVADFDLFLVPYELESSQGLKALINGLAENSVRKIAILVGPEGGIDENELELLINAGAKPITLGPRILRTETAGIAAVTMLQFALGDLGGQ